MNDFKIYENLINQFKEEQPTLFNKLTIIEVDLTKKYSVLVKDNYGVCSCNLYALIRGNSPSITTAIDKNSYFKNQLLEVNEEFCNSFEILSDYVTIHTFILVRNKYGICKVLPADLLRNVVPTIQSSINKTDYFKNQVIELHPNYFNNYVFLSEYVNRKTKIRVLTKYGICKCFPYDILKGSFPSILSAVNKTEYWINQAKEVHGDLYDYSLVKYVNSDIKVKIISEYGIFKQDTSSHLQGHGCPKLGRNANDDYHKNNFSNNYRDNDWINSGLASKNFDSFKCYIIRCWNDDEEFYKIGKTFRKIIKRFSSDKEMPYNYEIILIIEKESGLEICNIERVLQCTFKEYVYLPKIKFEGFYECFIKIELQLINEIVSHI